MKSIIFSYNRACQLDLLIRSHKRFWGEDISVIYRYSNYFYKQGYEKLKLKHPEVKMVEQTNFKQNTLDAMDGEYTVFFCDDEVMIRPLHQRSREFQTFLLDPRIVCMSLRLDKRYTDYVNAKNVMTPPKFGKYNTWDWRGEDLDWGYPNALSGHIFRTSVIKPIIERLEFNTPSSLEPQIDFDNSTPLMICFDRARNIGCPMNKVQTESPDPISGDISVEWLNKEFLSGNEIDLDSVIKEAKESKSCFKLIQYNLIKESKCQ